MSDVTVVQTPKGHTTIHYKGKMLATISGAGITREDRLKYAKIMAESLESHDTKEAHSDHVRPTTFDGIISEMREHIAMKMSDAWYTQDEWRNLCDRLEAAVNSERKSAERKGDDDGNK